MCREEVKTSHLLDDCPYTDKLFIVDNPWKAPDYMEAVKEMYEAFQKKAKKYDWAGISPHMIQSAVHKIDITSLELKLQVPDRRLEVFIPPEIEIEEEIPKYFIHVHTMTENHPVHKWIAHDGS